MYEIFLINFYLATKYTLLLYTLTKAEHLVQSFLDTNSITDVSTINAATLGNMGNLVCGFNSTQMGSLDSAAVEYALRFVLFLFWSILYIQNECKSVLEGVCCCCCCCCFLNNGFTIDDLKVLLIKESILLSLLFLGGTHLII